MCHAAVYYFKLYMHLLFKLREWLVSVYLQPIENGLLVNNKIRCKLLNQFWHHILAFISQLPFVLSVFSPGLTFLGVILRCLINTGRIHTRHVDEQKSQHHNTFDFLKNHSEIYSSAESLTRHRNDMSGPIAAEH